MDVFYSDAVIVEYQPERIWWSISVTLRKRCIYFNLLPQISVLISTEIRLGEHVVLLNRQY